MGTLTRGLDGTAKRWATRVTDQLVILGLPDAVVNAVPLQGVRFDATRPGAGDLLERFVEALVNAAAFVVQGLVLIGAAIAAFFGQAVAFLVELGMAVIGAIAAFLGQVAEAVDKVGEALVNLYSALISLFAKAIALIMSDAGPRLRAAFVNGISELASILDRAVNEFQGGIIAEETKKSFAAAVFGPLFATLAVTTFAIVVAMAILGTAILPFAFLVGLIVAVLIPAVLLAIAGGEEIRFAELNVPSTISLQAPSFFEFARGLIESGSSQSVSSFSGSNSDTRKAMLDTLAVLFEFLSAAFLAIFLAANLDVTGLGLLAQGLAVSIFAVLVSLLLQREFPPPISDLAAYGIGVVSLTLAVGGIAIPVVGFFRALKDPGNTIKLAGVYGLSLGCAGAAAFYSSQVLLVL